MDREEGGGIMLMMYVWECECDKKKCTLSKPIYEVAELECLDLPCPYREDTKDVFVRKSIEKEV